MEIRDIFIVLVDISGYTRFLKAHRVSLLHAEQIITQLLESVVAEAKAPLVFHELEGDAVNFYAVSDGSTEMAQDILTQVQSFIEAFRAKERELISECGLCKCEACQNVDKLKMKAIVHHGTAAFTKVRHLDKIGGQDVVLAHRLLKNSIEQDEYILLSDAFAALCGGIDGLEFERRTENCEGIGKVAVMVHYTEPPAEMSPVRKTLGQRLARVVSLDWYMIKKRFRPSPAFRNLRGLQHTLQRRTGRETEIEIGGPASAEEGDR